MAIVLTRRIWMGTFFWLGLYTYLLEGKDLGVYGHLFQIEEEDLLQVLTKRTSHLTKEEIDALRSKIQNHYAALLSNPPSVPGLKEATVYRVFYKDPLLCTHQEIKDHQGKVFVSKGKCINPLENIFHLDSLLFFDANQPMQLEWARGYPPSAKWVLTRGKPMDLEEKEGRSVYFDQLGVLVSRFGIQSLPAKVSHEGLQLKIEEIPLRGTS